MYFEMSSFKYYEQHKSQVVCIKLLIADEPVVMAWSPQHAVWWESNKQYQGPIPSLPTHSLALVIPLYKTHHPTYY